MPTIAKYVLDILGKKGMTDFEAASQTVEETQKNVLLKIIRDNQTCAFGNEHDFETIHSVSDFQEHVPRQSYDDISKYIDQLTLGAKNILTCEDPVLFATTSGTTGIPKYIPMNKTSRNDKSAVMRLWLYKASKDHPKMFEGKFFTLVSPEIESYTKGGTPCGAESGHAYRNIPNVMRKLYVAPYEVFLIKDYDSKYYTLLRLSVEHDVTFLGSCNPSTILLLARKMDIFKKDIIRDIHDGTLKKDLIIDDEIRKIITSGLTPNPKRASKLENFSKQNNYLLPKDVWPNMALIGCWTGGSVKIFLKSLRAYFPESTPIRDWGYLASELRGSLPLEDNSSSGVLTIQTNFYEFIRLDDIEKDDPTVYRAHELEKDEQYFVFMTTSAGLYRYEMNDIIRVDGFFYDAPLISFIQKGKGVSSLTGEKLYENQVIESVRETMQDMDIDFTFVSAVAEASDPPRYSFLIESLPDSTSREAKMNIIKSIDERLSIQNIEYESKRKSLRLGAPILKILAQGEMEKYRKNKVTSGTPDGQFKMMQLTSDFDFQKQFKTIEEISYDSVEGK